MTISLPYRRDRRYLTGVDWIIGVLDRMTKRATGAGNTSQILLELDGVVDGSCLREILSAFAAQFPVLSGHPSRDRLNLAPFWKIGRSAGRCAVEILPAQANVESAITALCRASDAPFSTDRDHLVFRLIHAGPDRSCLGMVFDHRLFDARGAEMFLDRLARFPAGDVTPPPPELARPVREAHLTDWAAKFSSGRNVTRAIRACASARPAAIPVPAGVRGFQHHFQGLDLEQSRRFTETAFSLSGFPVKLPCMLAMAVQAVDGLFAARGQAPEHFLVPVSIDRRAASADSQTLFFNHISFLHFLLPRRDIESLEGLVQALTRQMYGQTKDRLPEDFEETMFLMRILPVGLLASFSQRLFAGNFGTFAFSFLGETACRAREFLGHRILNLRHAPRVSTPPGLGIFLNEFDGRINVTVSSLEGLLTTEEAAGLARHFSGSRR